MKEHQTSLRLLFLYVAFIAAIAGWARVFYSWFVSGR